MGRLIVLVLVLTLGAIAGAAGVSATRPHAQAWRCITVRPGETLWDLAGRSSDGDRREVVYRIEQENGLSPRGPRAGESIWVPNEGDLTGLMEADRASCSPSS
ncbi:MAG: LysM peptidoglycan-binding domain-containing protein [Actinomycetota bacterium]